MTSPFIRNPALPPYLFPPITASQSELAFLDCIPLRRQDDIRKSLNGSAYQLKQLLTKYNQTLSKWLSGTMGEYCTGGYELLYRGEPKDLPPECLVRGNKMVYIIQLHYGRVKGPICLQYLLD